MDEIKLTILGRVKAKQSVKMGKWGGYTPTHTKEYANLIRSEFISKYPKHNPTVFENKRLFIQILVYFKVPNSWSKKNKQLALENKIRPAIVPDNDNIQKNICDSLNKFAYPDDKQIVDSLVRKFYAEYDYVEILIKEVKEN